MHDETRARYWYARLQEVLTAYDLVVPEGTAGAQRVTVPWHRDWGFWHLDASADDAAAAVDAARRAQRPWRGDERARRDALSRIADDLAESADLCAHLISFENGKLPPAARMEVDAAIGSLRLFAAAEIPEEVLRATPAETLRLVREPIGVVVAITPANMPLLMLVNKAATAMLVGNAVVAKPSPYTPLSAMLFGVIARRHLPAGVFQVVPGDAAIGRRLVEHPAVGLITLTGSRAAGKAVMAAAAGSLTRVHLELGGNDPAIVLDDAPLDEVLPEIFRSAFASSGQACVATKRLYVPRASVEKVTGVLSAMAEASRVGTPYDEDATHPALTNADQFGRVAALIGEVAAAGGSIRAGGVVDSDEGYFIRPTVVAGLADGSDLVDEEQFGPVLPIIAYDDVDAVLEAVNDGPYGLGATIWTADRGRGEDLAGRLEVGMAWINRTPRPDPTIPFGGVRESGIGREGGSAGLDSFCELKLIGGAERG